MSDWLYFAYGSNLSTRRLVARAASAQVVSVAELSGHVLQFRKRGRDGSAKCDIERTALTGDRVFGVVYRLARADWARLDAAEGLGNGYERASLALRTPAGEIVEAVTYCATAIDPALKPFHWYKEHVLRGAREHGLPAEYVAWIEAVESVADPDPARHEREMAIYREEVFESAEAAEAWVRRALEAALRARSAS